MNSLATRVNGLEMALDEISQSIAVSSGNVSDTDSSGNTCCMLPRAEFLSPKFWRKAEGQYSSSRVSLFGRKQLAYDVSDLPNKDADAEKVKPDNPNSQQQNGNNYPRPSRMPKNIVVSGGSGLDGGSVENFARYYN